MTADVDFEHVKFIAEKEDRLITFGPVEQGEFLKRMGGDVRLEALIKNAKSPENIEGLKSGYDMLTSPTKMGKRFKFLSMFPKVLEKHLTKFPPSGFTPK